MAYALVQSTTVFRSGLSNSSLAFASNLTAGNLAVMTASAWNQQVNTCSWAAGGSTAPSEAFQVGEGDANDFAYIFYSANTVAGAHTAQFNTTGGVDCSLVVAEFSGIATTTPLDQTTTNKSAGSTSISSGTTATLAQAGELVCGQAWHATASGDSVTATGTLTATPHQQLDNSGSQAFTFSHGRATTTSGVAATWTISTSREWKAGVATFKEGGAPPPTKAPALLPRPLRLFRRRRYL